MDLPPTLTLVAIPLWQRQIRTHDRIRPDSAGYIMGRYPIKICRLRKHITSLGQTYLLSLSLNPMSEETGRQLCRWDEALRPNTGIPFPQEAGMSKTEVV